MLRTIILLICQSRLFQNVEPINAHKEYVSYWFGIKVKYITSEYQYQFNIIWFKKKEWFGLKKKVLAESWIYCDQILMNMTAQLKV